MLFPFGASFSNMLTPTMYDDGDSGGQQSRESLFSASWIHFTHERSLDCSCDRDFTKGAMFGMLGASSGQHCHNPKKSWATASSVASQRCILINSSSMRDLTTSRRTILLRGGGGYEL